MERIRQASWAMRIQTIETIASTTEQHLWLAQIGHRLILDGLR